MRKFLLVLCLAPLMTGTAMAVQPLTENEMDAVIAGIANLPTLYGPGFADIGGGSNALSNAQAASQPAPTPAPYTAYNGCVPLPCNNVNLPPPPPPPPPPPTPTQQFSILLSSNGIGLR